MKTYQAKGLWIALGVIAIIGILCSSCATIFLGCFSDLDNKRSASLKSAIANVANRTNARRQIITTIDSAGQNIDTPNIAAIGISNKEAVIYFTDFR